LKYSLLGASVVALRLAQIDSLASPGDASLIKRINRWRSVPGLRSAIGLRCVFFLSLCAPLSLAHAQSPTPKAVAIPSVSASHNGAANAAATAPVFATTQDRADVKLEGLKLLALGPNEGRIVVQYPDGNMLTLRVGSAVPGTHAVLTSVLADKAVFDDVPSPTVGKQSVWMWKDGADATGRIQRFASGSQQNVSQHVPAEKSVALPISAGDGAAGNPGKSN